MLIGLSIRDLLLIDRLDIEFGLGLIVLTGETGAGKSILLDALGLATGSRGDSAVVRAGTDQSIVSAEFSLPLEHPAHAFLQEQAIASDDLLVLRRVIGRDGRSRAFINDQAVSVGLLRTLGDMLVEVHGQHDSTGLLNPASHRVLLDSYGDLSGMVAKCRDAYRRMIDTARELADVRSALETARSEEEYLRHAVTELDALSPMEGEEETLAAGRALMMNAEKLADDMNGALEALGGGADGGSEGLLVAALRRLERIAEKADGKLDPVLVALDRACQETIEARALLEGARTDLEFDPRRLEEMEARLFDLRALARKHQVTVDGLAPLRDRMSEQLDMLDHSTRQVADLEAAYDAAIAAYDSVAARLSEARRKTARKLDRAVAAELEPLKLGKAKFTTAVRSEAGEAEREMERGPDGIDRVEFMVATNPGAEPGSIGKIASGGELSRFMLALKVVLAKTSGAETLIFDEIDSAVGGAVADAIGDRLSRLAEDRQILVVTHSPQVAARGAGHFRVSKQDGERRRSGATATLTSVERLDGPARREEIARMLAGAVVTDAARAAADSLMDAAR